MTSQPEPPGSPSPGPSPPGSPVPQGPPATDAAQSVGLGLSLGWQMAVLYADPPATAPQPGAAAPQRLPSLGRLSGSERFSFELDQVEARIGRLGLQFPHSGIAELTTGAIRATWEGGNFQSLRVPLKSLHLDLLARLSGADWRVGKSYRLGASLSDACRRTEELEAGPIFEPYALAELEEWLADMASAFPPHAAHAVRLSLRAWSDWAKRYREDGGRLEIRERRLLFRVAVAPSESPGRRVARFLSRQGELWRALLTGEKSGTDMLNLKSYLATGARVAHVFRGGLAAALWRLWPVVLALAGIVGLGVVLLVNYNSAGHLVAGAVALVGGLGLSGKGLLGLAGRAAAHLERPVWGAEVDHAIAVAITALPDHSAPPVLAKRHQLSAAGPSFAAHPLAQDLGPAGAAD